MMESVDPRYEPNAKPAEVWNGWVPLEEYELLREAALLIAHAFAAKNPKWFSMAMGCEQDPSGVHAFLKRYEEEAWR